MCILDFFRLQMEVRVKKRKEGINLRRNKILSSKNHQKGCKKLSSIGKLKHRNKCKKCHVKWQDKGMPCMDPTCDDRTCIWDGNTSPNSSVKTQSTQFTDEVCCTCQPTAGKCSHKSKSQTQQQEVKVVNFVDVESDDGNRGGNDNRAFEGDDDRESDRITCDGSVNNCSFLNKYRKRLADIQAEEERLNARNKIKKKSSSSSLVAKTDKIITTKDTTAMPDIDRYGRLNVLRWLLLDAGMPGIDRTQGGALALHYAAARGCLECVKLLVETSPDFSANTQMDNAVTPVYLAAQEGHLEVLQYLVNQAGGRLDLRAKDGMAPVHASAQMGCLNCLKWMIIEQGVDLNLRDGDGASPLHFAASRGHVDTVRWLLKKGATISLDKFGKSPINDAADNEHMEVLQLLVQHGTAPDYGTDSDSTDSGSHHHQCTCHQGLRNCRKGSECSLTGSDSCASSCESDCHSSGNSSDSGVHHEPFYLHPPAGPENEIKQQKNTKNAFFLNPLNDLKEASEKHTKSKIEAAKSGASDDEKKSQEPFYLHQPEEVTYHRVQEVFGGKNSVKGSMKQNENKNATSKKGRSHTENEHFHDHIENGLTGSSSKENGNSHSKGEIGKSVVPTHLEYAKPNAEKKGKVNYESRELPKIPTSASPVKVKADIHSSDDAASTASSSSVENHYEDINPSRMGREGHPRESTRRLRSAKETSSPSKVHPSGSRQEEEDGDHDDDADSVEAKQRQRLQELDDLIAEFGDTSSGSGDSRSGDSLSGHRQLHSTHSVPPHTSSSSTTNSYLHQRSPLLRTSSEPTPPPPPPMPSGTPSPRSSPAVVHRNSHQSRDGSSSKSPLFSSSHDSSSRLLDSRDINSDISSEDAIIRPSEFIRRNSQRGDNGSFRGHKKVDRPMSLPLDVAEHYGKIMSNGKDRPITSTQDDSSHATLPGKHLTNGKSLPFIPPKFPSQPSGSGLIKPSEYLRSLGSSTTRSPSGDVKSLVALHLSESSSFSFEGHDQLTNGDSQPASMPPGPLPAIPEATEEEPSKNSAGAPPPPPAPPAPSSSSSSNTLNRSNTLSSNNTSSKSMLPTISVTDLQSVQLRKTETKVSRTTSVPLRVPLSPEPALTLAKNDVIAELKMGVDIPGIKKLKSEKAKEEAKMGKLEKDELKKQFSAVNFVDQIPETDNAGNQIPEWKRQMLARKAAERAKKNAEEARQQQLEEKRLQAIPPWKRQLMMRKDEDGKRSSLYIPKVEDVKKIHIVNSPKDISRIVEKDDNRDDDQVPDLQTATDNSSHLSCESSQHSSSVEDKEEPRMPWRTNLRKTNSKLSLLE